ncbi:hypothetical protein RSK60_2990002 [Ralstonia solanacearum K60]|nr:hypothetical protein RSK60_2990002 [Ralstonia solanacearum K60]
MGNVFDNTVSIFAINTSTGALTLKSTLATGNDPLAITLNDAGSIAYIVNGVDHDVVAYKVDSSTGALTSVATAQTGLLPRAFAIVAVP